MEELININDYVTLQLPHFVKFTVDMKIEKPYVYKEDIHTNLYQVISRMTPEYKSQNNVLMGLSKEESADNEKLIFSQIGLPDYNYQSGYRLAIADNLMRIEYFELRQDDLSLPNIGNVLTLLITVVEAIGVQTNNFSSLVMDVIYKVETNAKAGFYKNYSPFNVNLVPTITYYASNDAMLHVHVEKQDVMYQLVRRFYQLFKNEAASVIPYLDLNKEQFEKEYACLWLA